jgi:hypothetical protein
MVYRILTITFLALTPLMLYVPIPGYGFGRIDWDSDSLINGTLSDVMQDPWRALHNARPLLMGASLLLMYQFGRLAQAANIDAKLTPHWVQEKPKQYGARKWRRYEIVTGYLTGVIASIVALWIWTGLGLLVACFFLLLQRDRFGMSVDKTGVFLTSGYRFRWEQVKSWNVQHTKASSDSGESHTLYVNLSDGFSFYHEEGSAGTFSAVFAEYVPDKYRAPSESTNT